MTKAEAFDELLKVIRQYDDEYLSAPGRVLGKIRAKAHELELRLEFEPDFEDDDRK